MVWSTEAGAKQLDGRTCWDLQNFNSNDGRKGMLERTGGAQITLGQHYTQAFWVHWQPSDDTEGAGWRSLFHNDKDHLIIVGVNNKNLGFFSNRDGQMRKAGVDITTGSWQFVAVTGEGDSATSATGVSTFFLGDDSTPPAQVGTADRVGSGTSFNMLGFKNIHAPGCVAMALHWDRLLTGAELAALHAATKMHEDRFVELSPKGYCTDYRYPGTGTQAGGYDHVSNDAAGCMARCQAVIPGTSSFYLLGTRCGCSATTSGPCAITAESPYTAYEIMPGAQVVADCAPTDAPTDAPTLAPLGSGANPAASCKAILDSGAADGDGMYTLAEQGETYCDMTSSGGGWTLLNQFGDTDQFGIGQVGIHSSGGLIAAGWTTNADTIYDGNGSSGDTSAGHSPNFRADSMHFFKGGVTPAGFIERTLPDPPDGGTTGEVRVKYAHVYQQAAAHLFVGGTEVDSHVCGQSVHTNCNTFKIYEGSYTKGDKVRLDEGPPVSCVTIFWVFYR